MGSVDLSDVDVDLASCTANTAPGAIEEEARLMAGAQVFFSSRRGGSVCRRRQLIVTSWLDEMLPWSYVVWCVETTAVT